MKSGSLTERCSCGSCGHGCDCGCCEGTEPLTPQTIANRPGLDALAYRIGTHSSFLETMKARLSNADHPALRGLTTRDESDPAIALLDAWAVVAGVLTFYQERIANEGYLRTATERRSVLELARLVGYAPRPGVAASTWLAYLLDPGPETVIPAGSGARSVPGPGEMPQTFETSEDLTARAAWNNLQVRLTRPQQPEKLAEAPQWPVVLCFKGIATNLKPNDPLLIRTGGPTPKLYRVLTVEPDAAKDRTCVAVEPWWKIETIFIPVSPGPNVSGEVLREIVERARDPEAQGVSRGAMAQRVVSHLDPLKAALDEGAAEPELRAGVEEVLPRLREELQAAERIGASRVQPWIAGLTQDLEEILAVGDNGAIAERSASGPPPTGQSPRTTTTISRVLETLGKRPRPQPASSRQLDRNVGELFGPGSDLGAKLLLTARPELREVLYQAWANVPAAPPPVLTVCALRMQVSVFGHNAPLKFVRTEDGENQNDVKVAFEFQEWQLLNPSGQFTEKRGEIWLDGPYPQILPESWIVLKRPEDPPIIAQVKKVSEQSRAEYGISPKSTRIELDRDWIDPEKETFATIRGTAVFAQCEELILAEEPIVEPLCGGTIEFAALYDGLEPGRWLIVAGERTDVGELDAEKRNVIVPVPGVPAAEIVMLAGVKQEAQDRPGEYTHTTLTLAKPLAYCYRRDTLKIYGNVAHATHGETRFEVLGSGDGSKPLQSFTLKQPPLTYVSAPTPSGIESTLQVRVNDVLWREADSLAGLGPTDRSYILRTDDEAKTTVVFGNGKRGARLPTGIENVRATYRNGIGKPGNVKAGQITQLSDKPLGVKDVINPLPATGGADRESRDQARRNAPLALFALDRLISVQDYEDFTRTFAGIGKASAASLSDGRVRLVHVTLAGEDDIPIREDSDLFQNLEAALLRFGDPRQPLRLELREASFLVLQAEVRVLPEYQWEKVEPKIRAALLDAFSFARRDLGQDALLSEVYQTVQGVRGVDFLDVDVFGKVTASVDLEKVEGPPAKRLVADLARNDPEEGILPAQLLYFTLEVPDTLILKERKS